MPVSGSAVILGSAGQWSLKVGEIDLSLFVCDTSEGPLFSLILANFATEQREDEDGNEMLSPFIEAKFDHAEFQRLAECFVSATAAVQAVAAKRPANDG